MKVLTIFADKEIRNEKSDVYKRHADYSNLVDEFHVQYFDDQNGVSKNNSLFFYALNSKNIFSLIKNLSQYIKENNIDLLICPRPFYPGIITFILKILTRKKILMSIYGSNFYQKKWFTESFKNFIFRIFFGPIIINFSDYIQTDSKRDLIFFENKFKNKKIFWKPMIPENISDFNFKRELNENKNFNIIFIGRLVLQKNIKMLSKIVENILQKNPRVVFSIIGDGYLSKFIKDLKNKHANRIFWYKNLDRENVVSFYKNADLLLLCSNYEGFPRVFMEASMSAIPIVTSDVSGVEDVVIEGETGFIIKNDSTNDFVEALNFLEKHREMSYDLGIKSRENFMRLFNYDTTLNAQKEVFEYIKNNLLQK